MTGEARETLTETLRRRVREAAGVTTCPTCGQPTPIEGGVRSLAASIGIPHAVLWRFLGGKDMTGRNLDIIEAWLSREAPRG